MKEYEDRKYEAWKEQVEANLLIYLKKNLLSKPSTSSATTHRSVVEEGTNSEEASGSLLAAALQSQGEISTRQMNVSKACMVTTSVEPDWGKVAAVAVESPKIFRSKVTFKALKVAQSGFHPYNLLVLVTCIILLSS